MLEGIVLLAFIAALAGCVFTGVSVLWALAGGYLQTLSESVQQNGSTALRNSEKCRFPALKPSAIS